LVSLLVKYGPIAAGVLQYLSVLPETSDIERTSAIDKLDWDTRSFDATHRSKPNRAVTTEMRACSSLLLSLKRDAAQRLLTQGSATVTWSGVGALLRNLAILLEISPDSMTLHGTASQAIGRALGEVFDTRGNEATLILTTDAEHHSGRSVLEDRLKPYITLTCRLFPSRISCGAKLPRKKPLLRC
jgi:hypothetical protein